MARREQIDDPIIIGYPSHEEPKEVGRWRGHGLSDLLIGSHLMVTTNGANATFRVNVSYLLHAPKREKIRYILEPIGPVPDEFWEGDGLERIHNPPRMQPKQEEFPF